MTGTVPAIEAEAVATRRRMERFAAAHAMGLYDIEVGRLDGLMFALVTLTGTNVEAIRVDIEAAAFPKVEVEVAQPG